jgi:hypothetical protein
MQRYGQRGGGTLQPEQVDDGGGQIIDGISMSASLDRTNERL